MPEPPTTHTSPVVTTARTGVTPVAPVVPERQQLASTGVDSRLLGLSALVLLTGGIIAAISAVIRRRGAR